MADSNIVSAKRDIIISIFLICLAVFAIVVINSGEFVKTIETGSLTHATLPTIYGVLLMLLSGSLLINAVIKVIAFRKQEKAGGTIKNPNEKQETGMTGIFLLRFFGTVAMLVAYAMLLAYVNFIILTVLFLAILFVLYGRKSPLKIALASIIGGTAFYILFIAILNLPL
jgi:hypothetical protein